MAWKTQPHKILVTGAGGSATPNIIQRLSVVFEIIAVDTDPNAPWLHIGTTMHKYVVPRGDSPIYVQEMQKICAKHGIDLIIPLVDEELIPSFDIGPPVLLPQKRFVETCLDKYRLMRVLEQVGIRTPETKLLIDNPWDIGYPAILKPRTGRGSRGVKRLDTFEQYYEEYHGMALFDRAALSRHIVQRYIDGPEYTVSVIVDMHGTIHGVVPKEVIHKEGITKIAVTRHNAAIDVVCREVQNKLLANGPFNVQLRLERGSPVIFEINPRYSTTTVLTTSAFSDEVLGLASMALGKPFQWANDFAEGRMMIRYYTTFIDHETQFSRPEVLL